MNKVAYYAGYMSKQAAAPSMHWWKNPLNFLGWAPMGKETHYTPGGDVTWDKARSTASSKANPADAIMFQQNAKNNPNYIPKLPPTNSLNTAKSSTADYGEDNSKMYDSFKNNSLAFGNVSVPNKLPETGFSGGAH